MLVVVAAAGLWATKDGVTWCTFLARPAGHHGGDTHGAAAFCEEAAVKEAVAEEEEEEEDVLPLNGAPGADGEPRWRSSSICWRARCKLRRAGGRRAGGRRAQHRR